MRIVVKVGTSTLAHSTGRLNIRHTEDLVKVLSDLKNAGHEVILVSSGAIGMGVGKLSLPSRPGDMATKQACAAVGQCELMYTYDRLFTAYNHNVAQILLTGVDVEHEGRRLNFQNTLSRLQGRYARAGLFHCMQTGSSGFRFQDAVRHGHAVFMAQGEMCPQAVCFHPLGAPAGKAIDRCPAGQADGFDLAEGEGLPQTGARRLEESLLGRKVRRRAGHGMGGASGRVLFFCQRQAQCRLLRRAEHPACKDRAMGAQQALFHPRNAAQVAADSVDHEKPPERENSLRSFYSNFQKFLFKVCKFQLGILKSAFISCTMGYKFQ